MPAHRIYVEPFGGAASVLLKKPRSHAEVYNDLSEDVVTAFRVLRDPRQAELLRRAVELTPFSRVEFERAYQPSPDPIERSRRLFFRAFAGFASGSATASRPKGMRTTSTTARSWATWADQVPRFVDRLRGVVIEHRPAAEVIATHDGEDTLHYVDPPYLHATRNVKDLSGLYAHEMDDGAHRALLEQLIGLAGSVLLSAYPNPLYSRRLKAAGWQCLYRRHVAAAARISTEVLWLNPRAQRGPRLVSS